MKIHQRKRDQVLLFIVPNLFALATVLVALQLPMFDSDDPTSLSTQAAIAVLGGLLLILRELGEYLFEYLIAKHRSMPRLMNRLELMILRIKEHGSIHWQTDERALRNLLEATGDSLAVYDELSRFADFLADHKGDPNISTFKGINAKKLRLFEQALRIAVEEIER